VCEELPLGRSATIAVWLTPSQMEQVDTFPPSVVHCRPDFQCPWDRTIRPSTTMDLTRMPGYRTRPPNWPRVERTGAKSPAYEIVDEVGRRPTGSDLRRGITKMCSSRGCPREKSRPVETDEASLPPLGDTDTLHDSPDGAAASLATIKACAKLGAATRPPLD